MENKKVGIIGVGNVGASLGYILATKAMCDELVLKDIREEYLEAMMLDISQASFAANSKTAVSMAIKAEDFTNCDVVVITAGIARKPGMSRDDLLLTNTKIITSVVKETVEYNPNAVIIIVSNPLDAMVYAALKASNLDRTKVIGMAGILDSSRMKHFIYEKLGNKSEKIVASVMGGHGDSMVPLPNFSSVGDKALTEVLSAEDIEEIVEKTKNGGAQIVKLLATGSAYYAPGYSSSVMVDAILNDTKESFPCAVMLEGEYGFKDIVSGVPVKLGKNGVEEIVELELNDTQKELFANSVASVQELVDTIEKNS